jgi:hypothetical protein
VRTQRLVAAAVILWASALGYSVRALPASSAVPPQAGSPAASQPPSAEAPAEAASPANTDCLDCHADESTAREKGPRLEVINAPAFTASVHGELSCVDCHQDPAAAELPHPEKLQKADCASCHSDETDLHKLSVHAHVRPDGAPVATCASCHGTHDIRATTDPESRTHHLKVAQTCAACHDDPRLVARGTMRRQVAQAFNDSIHGTVLEKSGLVVAPTCTTCHGSHDVRHHDDPASPVARTRVADTCGKCHQGVAQEFHGGVHAAMLRSGAADAPACQTCHTAHNIARSDNAAWELSVINQCGTCHVERVATFRDTFHGQVTALGSRSVAGCADCHGAHQVLPASDPRSPVAPANLVKTCGKCHENAGSNFVKYDPHADKHDRERHPGLFYTAKFMTFLLAGVFGFFGLHTALWFRREIQVKRAGRDAEREDRE